MSPISDFCEKVKSMLSLEHTATDQQKRDKDILRSLAENRSQYTMHSNGTISMNLNDPDAQRRVIAQIRKLEGLKTE